MKNISFALILSSATFLALSACDSMPPATAMQIETANGHYWQRKEVSSAIYQRGPKAQQLLFKDISRCTYEVRELQRLGAIRASTPADPDAMGNIPDPSSAQGHLAEWDTPERDGYLYNEHSDYHDFETCMQAAGWERVQYLPYNTATEARDTYVDTILQEQRRTNTGQRDQADAPEPGDFDGLNN